MSYTCTTSTATVYQIGGDSDIGYFWADITIRDFVGGGSLDIQSDFGSFSNKWCCIGPNTFREFLCSLNMNYFMDKCKPYLWKEYDGKATVDAIYSDILQERREKRISKEKARELWDNFDGDPDLDYNELTDIHIFEEVLEDIYYGDYENVPYKDKPTNDAQNFWNIIWPCICEVWEKEISEKRETND